MQQNHRANVWITPETRDRLKAIGEAHGAAQGREMSPGIRVAAGFHGRLVNVLELVCGDDKDLLDINAARALLKEIEEAR